MKSFKNYDDFSAANRAAKAAVASELGLHWHLVPGASVLARLPAPWCACKVYGRVSKSPRDVRLPAARYWPNGTLPVGPVYEAEYQWATPIVAPRQYDSHCNSRIADMAGKLEGFRRYESDRARATGALSEPMPEAA